jgi:hypothetical protein
MGESRCKGAFIEWPVLAPTYVFPVKRNRFLQRDGEPLSEVAARLQSYLSSIRRSGDPIEFGWFRLPGGNGFAVLGQTHALNERAEVIPDPLMHSPPFLSSRYWRELLNGAYTHYRTILFVVAGEEVPTRDQTDTRYLDPFPPLHCGQMAPPGELREFHSTASHQIYLYLYELERGTAAEFGVTPRSSAAYSAQTHLDALGMSSIVE